VTQLVDDLYDSLFAAALANDQHVLRYNLPDRNNHSFSLRRFRPRRRELLLATKLDSIETLLKERLLFKNMY